MGNFSQGLRLLNLLRFSVGRTKDFALMFGVDRIKILCVYHPNHLNFSHNGMLACDKIDPLLDCLDDDIFSVVRIVLPPSKVLMETRALEVNRFFLKSILTMGLKRIFLNHLKKLGYYEYSFECLLKKMKPDLVVGIGSNVDLLKPLGRSNIPYLEVQHGWLSPDYIENFYNGAKRPNYFLCWNEYYSKLIANKGIPSMVIGHPNLEHYFSLERKLHDKILIPLTHHLENSIDPFGMLGEDVAQMLRVILTKVDAKTVIFRLHPGIFNDFNYQEIKSWINTEFPGAGVADPRQVPLSNSLADARVIFGTASSISIEAARLGISSFLFPLDNANSYYEFLADETVDYIDGGLIETGIVNLINTSKSKNFETTAERVCMSQIENYASASPTPDVRDIEKFLLHILRTRN